MKIEMLNRSGLHNPPYLMLLYDLLPQRRCNPEQNKY
jgi:hypothetical protein